MAKKRPSTDHLFHVAVEDVHVAYFIKPIAFQITNTSHRFDSLSDLANDTSPSKNEYGDKDEGAQSSSELATPSQQSLFDDLKKPAAQNSSSSTAITTFFNVKRPLFFSWSY